MGGSNLTEVHMPKLRHLAIRTEDTGKLAQFYMDVFEMELMHKDKKEGGAIFLSDGYFNLAILPNHEQNAPNGLYHFGFQVESGEKIVERMKKVNPNKLPKPRPDGRPYAEVRGSDPDGNYFDISEHGFLKVEPVGEPKPKPA
jgi:catechol-2,3-dioxygenase